MSGAAALLTTGVDRSGKRNAGAPDLGAIGVLATFTTPAEGIIGSDSDTTDTGI